MVELIGALSVLSERCSILRRTDISTLHSHDVLGFVTLVVKMRQGADPKIRTNPNSGSAPY
jgi:hypothetical protein